MKYKNSIYSNHDNYKQLKFILNNKRTKVRKNFGKRIKTTFSSTRSHN